MPPAPTLPPELFTFCRRLKKNNDRAWFKAHQDEFEAHVREPLLAFIAAFAPRLEKISPHFVADPSRQGGSMFRIHRDVRFSRDKSPYKTFASAQFRHEQARDVHAPGFYLHLAPGEVFMGAGLWHPDGPSLKAIREAIVADPAKWKRLTSGKAFRETFTLAGESLKRPPRGFDAEHPLSEDLKRKDFIVVANFDEKTACAPDFITVFTKRCRSAMPFVRWLCAAVGVEA